RLHEDVVVGHRPICVRLLVRRCVVHLLQLRIGRGGDAVLLLTGLDSVIQTAAHQRVAHVVPPRGRRGVRTSILWMNLGTALSIPAMRIDRDAAVTLRSTPGLSR